MRWTTKKPTVPEYYWYWDEPNEPEIVEICKHGKSLIVWVFGSDGFSHLRGLPETAKWAGPIERPE